MLHKFDLSLAECEIKLAKDSGRFEGYASVFGGVDSYGDTIERGAFSGTLEQRNRMPLMLFGHNPGRVIGKWLSLAEDSKGLIAEGEFTPGHSDAQNALASLKHGAIDGLSIGFRIPKGGAEEKSGGGRIITDIDLVEISVVTMPADDSARIHAVKEHVDAIASMRDAEEFLRDSGYSRGTAQTLLSRIKTIVLRDSVPNGGDEMKEIAERLIKLAQIPESILTRRLK